MQRHLILMFCFNVFINRSLFLASFVGMHDFPVFKKSETEDRQESIDQKYINRGSLRGRAVS